MNQGKALGVLGGVLIAGGTVLPWITATAALAGTVTRSGLELGGDPVLLGVIGIIGALVMLVASTGAYAAAFVAGLAGLYVGWTSYGSLQERAATLSGTAIAAVGPGIYVSLAGCVLLLIGAVAAYRGGER